MRIEVAGPDKRARRLRLEDDSECVRLTSAAVVRQLGLEDGDEAQWGEVLDEIEAIEYECAKERGFRLLGYRERSDGEVRSRLSNDGYPAEVVGRVSERFRELDLVDDSRFARLWARQRIAAGYGTVRIMRELGQKGIDAEVATEAIREAAGDATQVERATAVLGGKSVDTQKDRQKAIGRLVRRGFGLGDAVRAVEVRRSASDSNDEEPFVGE